MKKIVQFFQYHKTMSSSSSVPKCSQNPFIYKDGVVRYDRSCAGIPYSTQLLLGARYRDARSFYLFWDPVSSTLTTGLNIQIIDSTPAGTPPINVVALASQDVSAIRVNTGNSRVAFLASRNMIVENGKNVLVAGLELSEPFTLSNFENSIVTGNLVTSQKIRIGSLIDQGSSFTPPPTCGPSYSLLRSRLGSYRCERTAIAARARELEGSSADCCEQSAQQSLDFIAEIYGNTRIRNFLNVDKTIYAGSVLAEDTVSGKLGSFSQTISGSYVGGIEELPASTIVRRISGGYRESVIEVAPINNSVIIILDSTIVPFFSGTSLTIKDITQKYYPNTTHNVSIQVSPGVFIETYDDDGNLIRVNGGTYILDTTGGSVTFTYSAPLIAEGELPPPDPYLVWEITNQFKGNPRLLTLRPSPGFSLEEHDSS